MTLGQFIQALKNLDPETYLFLGFGYPVSTFSSYRGCYRDIALHWTPYGQLLGSNTVKDVLEEAMVALRATFTGWKGGNYRMYENTRLWISNPGDTEGLAVVDVQDDGIIQIWVMRD